MIRLLIAFLLVAASAPSAKAPADEFRARRAALRQALEDGVLFLKGQPEAYDQIFRFQQTPDFYYLTGWNEPGAASLVRLDIRPARRDGRV